MERRGSVVINTTGWHADDLGSIPGRLLHYGLVEVSSE